MPASSEKELFWKRALLAGQLIPKDNKSQWVSFLLEHLYYSILHLIFKLIQWSLTFFNRKQKE